MFLIVKNSRKVPQFWKLTPLHIGAKVLISKTVAPFLNSLRSKTLLMQYSVFTLMAKKRASWALQLNMW